MTTKQLEKEKQNRFEIDDEGFREQCMDIPPYRLCNDMMQNCIDEESITKFTFNISKTKSTAWEVRIEDDGKGFKKPSDSYTLYGNSYKRKDPTKIGQFNLGEKQFFAVCIEGEITTKDLKVVFPLTGGRIETKLDTPHKGTSIRATFDWNQSEVNEILDSLNSVIIGQNQTFLVNGKPVQQKELIKSFKCTLKCPVENENKRMVQIERETEVELYKVKEGKKAWLYEIGIPVCELEGNIEWHVNVKQKVPQTHSRDVISEAYLKRLYGNILNNAVQLISEDHASSTFVQIGMKSAKPEVAREVFKKVYDTEDVYIGSQTDWRANEKAIKSGGQLIKDKWLDGEARNHLQDVGVISRASETFGTDYGDTEKIEPNEDMVWFQRVTTEIMVDTVGDDFPIYFVKSKEVTDGAWLRDVFGQHSLTFNTSRLGKSFFKEYKQKQIELTIHELAHYKAGVKDGMAHLSNDFIDETIRIGAMIGEKGINWYIEKIGVRS